MFKRGRSHGVKLVIIAGLVLFFIASGSCLAEPAPRDEVLRYVPDDVGFCLLVQDLRSHSADLLGSPFFRQVKLTSWAGALAGSKDMERLRRSRAVLESKLGIDWPTVRDEILGDAVVFAYRPGPPDDPKQEEGWLVVRARSADRLAQLMARLNEVEKKDGELREVEELHFQENTYYRRVGRRKTSYYFLRDRVLILSEQEKAVQHCLAQARQERGEPAMMANLREMGLERPAAVLWINPRAFDTAIQKHVSTANKNEAATRQLVNYWKALASVMVTLDLDEELHLGLALKVDRSQAPEALREALSRPAQPSELWQRFPDTALVAIAGRLDPSRLFTALCDFMPAQDREALQGDLNRTMGAILDRDVVKEVLPALGPDWGLCVMAPGKGQGHWPQALFCLRVQPSADGQGVGQSLYSALSSLAMIWVVQYNQQHREQPVTLRRLPRTNPEIKYLSSSGLPVGVEPAFGLHQGYLMLASSVRLLESIGRSSERKQPGDWAPLLRISARGWRAYLGEHREELAVPLARSRGTPIAEVREQLEQLFHLSQLLDRLELRQRVHGSLLAFTLDIQAAQSMRK